jgi:hypothetical protein
MVGQFFQANGCVVGGRTGVQEVDIRIVRSPKKILVTHQWDYSWINADYLEFNYEILLLLSIDVRKVTKG